MHNFHRVFISIIIVMLASGCASGVPFSEMKPELTAVNLADEGRIFLYRPSAFGAAVKPKIHLNDEIIGKSVAKGFTFVDRPAGEYVLSMSTEVERNLSFVLKPGETRYIKQSVSMGFFVGHVYGELVDKDEALKEMESCKFQEPMM